MAVVALLDVTRPPNQIACGLPTGVPLGRYEPMVPPCVTVAGMFKNAAVAAYRFERSIEASIVVAEFILVRLSGAAVP